MSGLLALGDSAIVDNIDSLPATSNQKRPAGNLPASSSAVIQSRKKKIDYEDEDVMELMTMSLQELDEIWKDEGAENKKLAEMERWTTKKLEVGWDGGHFFCTFVRVVEEKPICRDRMFWMFADRRSKHITFNSPDLASHSPARRSKHIANQFCSLPRPQNLRATTTSKHNYQFPPLPRTSGDGRRSRRTRRRLATALRG